ncbi:rop guanine nucleotide exchange factor 1 [Prosopis cineraria]|uniref:rop guanine nucleotide exchange factor 1 n=1 Tax=Prosopis cineraria TaxID=364024 RepID=UPI002410861B|nr:rop guanine nucleotide exchange factor 1 [Prosopis cineraria]
MANVSSPDQLSEQFQSHTSSAEACSSESLSNYDHNNSISLPITPIHHSNFPAPELEVEMMKERFAKLLLGEDMSGGGKGVCSALAISNAITNLSASVFGELWRLEPLAPQKRSMWEREMDWLLCVSDSIVELVPSTRDFPGGGTFETMVPRVRPDIHLNLPALKKLDSMLLGILDGFRDSEFYYVDRGVIVDLDVAPETETNMFPLSASSGRPSIWQEEKWWLPFPKVPQHGLSQDMRKRLQQSRECTHQILKAALAINSTVLSEMKIPHIYLDNLPKSGRALVGDIIYNFLCADKFSSECVLDYLGLSSEYSTLEIANRMEASMHIWRQKHIKGHVIRRKGRKSSWSGKVKGMVSHTKKHKLLAQRAETLLQNLRQKFPGLPQTALDMSKIQNNKDVGQAILESYSRVMESLAFNVLARIDDLIYIDDAASNLPHHNRNIFLMKRG